MKKILVIHGPNLNLLGLRPKEHYGTMTLAEINRQMQIHADPSWELEFFQSNSEGEIVTKIQQSLSADAIIINPAAYTHTSVAIRDALEIFPKTKIEVHLSNVDQREDFRKINYIRDVCDVCFSGKLAESYLDAIEYLKKN